MPSTLKEEWSGRRDSIPRLTAWKSVALPTELLPHVVVGAAGFEPATPWSQTRCATRLRYAPTIAWCTRYMDGGAQAGAGRSIPGRRGPRHVLACVRPRGV